MDTPSELMIFNGNEKMPASFSTSMRMLLLKAYETGKKLKKSWRIYPEQLLTSISTASR